MSTLAQLRVAPRGPLHVAGLTVLDGTGAFTTETSLVVDGPTIRDLGTRDAVAARWPQLPALDGRGFTVTPGLVNAHTHAAMGFFRGLGHGRDNMIESFFFPAEKALTAELLEPLSYSYLYAGLRAGVTSFGDHYYFADGVALALERFGLRGAVGETVADLGGAFPGRRGWDLWRQRISQWPYSSRIRPVVAPHAADTVSPALLRELAAFATSHALPLHMHLSQTAGERSRVFAREKLSPVAYAAQCGALTPRTLAVHLVTVDAADIQTLRDHGVTAGLCPASQIIYEQLAPLAPIMDAGIPVALGTDCAASNDGADMLAEMRLTGLLAKDRGAQPDRFEPGELLRMGAAHGAQVLGLGSGRIAAGEPADLVFFAEDLGSEPATRPDANLIYSLSSRQAQHVMVDGRFVLLDRRLTLADEKDLTMAFRSAVAEIHRRIAAAPQH